LKKFPQRSENSKVYPGLIGCNAAKLNPDFAFEYGHTYSIHSKSALSRKLVVNEIVF
jgi:hypothetical protein